MEKFSSIVLAAMGAVLLGYLQYYGYYYLPFISGNFKTPQDLHDSYDYIVDYTETGLVGAGSAGGIVASRLSEDLGRTVLLLEAGGEETQKGLTTNYVTLTLLTWITRFAQLRGYDGPLEVTEAYPTSVGETVLRVARKLGYDVLTDYNGKKQEGFGRFQFNTDRSGRRQSTAYSYVRPAMKRKNLHVIKDAHVTKVLADGSPKTATGVEYIYNGFRHTVSARREIVVSGGSVNSPQILMLSGIGPRKHLEELGIPVVVDNPAVGQNLIDHYWSYLSWTINSTKDGIYQRDSELLRTIQYFATGNGRLSTTGMEVTAFVHSGVEPKTDTPDIQLFFLPYDASEGWENIWNLKPEVAKAAENLGRDKPKIWFSSTLQQPKSVGQLRLKSKDPEAHPLIDPQYGSNERDLDAIVAGLKLTLKIVHHPQFKKHDPKPADELIPGCEKYPMLSDEYLKCHVRHKTLTLYHPASTCRMGPTKENAVVDPRLRVYGVKNLRVMDTSIFPDHVTGNTNVPTMMIAEKGAHMIKEDNP